MPRWIRFVGFRIVAFKNNVFMERQTHKGGRGELGTGPCHEHIKDASIFTAFPPESHLRATEQLLHNK